MSFQNNKFRAHVNRDPMLFNRSLLTLAVAAAFAAPSVVSAQTAGITNFVYVTTGYDAGLNKLAIVNAATGQVYQSVNIGNALMATDPAISPNGGLVYVPSAIDQSLRTFDVTTGTLQATLGLPNPSWASAISRDGSKLYLGTTDFSTGVGSVTVVNLAGNTVAASIPVGLEPEASTISADGSKLLVANYGSNSVSIIDTSTNQVAATVNVGLAPRGIAISQDGTKAYVANADSGTVSVINLASNTVSATINLGGPMPYPRGIAISPDGSKLYVANYNDHSVSVINTATNAVAATVNIKSSGDHNDPGEFPMGISVSPDGSKIFVASQGCAVSSGCSDPNSFAPGYLTVINTADNSIVRQVNVGFAPNMVGSFVGPNLITGNYSVASSAALASAGFGDSINMAGGTLTATDSFSTSRAVYLHSAFNLGSGAFTSSAGGTIDSNGNNFTLSGIISGLGGLTKTGVGVLELLGANTYSGGTTVSAGTLQGNATSLQGNIVNNAIVVFDQATNGTYAGAMSGSGALNKQNAGTLTLSGVNFYSGATTVSGGTLDVSGALASSAVSVNNGGTLSGTGTLGQSVAINSGGVLVAGDGTAGSSSTVGSGGVTFASGSTYRVAANDSGSSSRLTSSGMATINGGTVSVQASAGTWSTTTSYTILSASGGVTGSFSGASSSLAFLTPSLGYDANNVYLTLARNSTDYATAATTPNQRAVATVLQSASSGATGDTGALIQRINSLSVPEAQAAFQRLSGDSLPAQSGLGLSLSSDFAGRLQDRWASVGNVVPVASSLASLKLAFNGNVADALSLMGQNDDFGQKRQHRLNAAERNGLSDMGGAWVRAFGQWKQQNGDSDKGLVGVNGRTAGTQFGLDREVLPGTLVGTSVAYGNTSLSYDQSVASGSSQFWQAGAYALHRTGNWRLAGSLVYGSYANKLNRNTIAGTAKSDYDADSWTVIGQAAYSYAMDCGWNVEPGLTLQAIRYRQDGFVESGAPGANLAVASQKQNSLQSTLGMRFTRVLGRVDSPHGEVGFNLGWRHEFGNVDNMLTASFAASPGAGSFSTIGAQRDRNALLFGVGFNRQASKRLQIFASLDSAVSHHENTQTLMAGIKVKW